MLKTTVKKLPGSMVEIEGELAAETFESYFKKALAKVSANVELDGFRKGKVPEHILLANIPEMSILEEMAELALTEHYPKILEAESIDAISRPDIAITKIARNNPLGFSIKTAVMPEITLPKYKEIAKKVTDEVSTTDKKIEVTDEDVENTIMDIRKSRAPKKHMKGVAEDPGAEADREDGKDNSELPEMNDEFVQAIGPFKDVADFTEKLKVNLKLEKENQAKEKTRLKIMEGIIEATTLEIPEMLVNIELDKILYRMESDISQMGLTFEDYLKHLNKTVSELRTEFKPDAEKKAKLALILNEIAKSEKIEATDEEIESEVNHILEHYKDADRERARMHAENVLTNEKIFKFLESLE